MAGFAGTAAGWRWRPVAAQLRWDGQGWSLLPAGSTGRRWLPLSRRGHRTAWHALRCALQARGVEGDPLASAQV